jgi:hypothetical protein
MWIGGSGFGQPWAGPPTLSTLRDSEAPGRLSDTAGSHVRDCVCQPDEPLPVDGRQSRYIP